MIRRAAALAAATLLGTALPARAFVHRVVLQAPAPGQGTSQAPPAVTTEVIADVRVHGNQVATDDEVLTLAAVTIGAPFVETTTIAGITARLEASKRFEHVTVLKRFASIADPSRVLIVIVVDEGPVRLEMGKTPGAPFRVVRRGFLRNLMFLPILDAEDGYGLTYGVRVALVGVTAPTGRLSFPLSWGGLKQAGAEFDRTFVHRPIDRLLVDVGLMRQTNPAYEVDDHRRRISTRGERNFGPLRLGVTGGWQHVSFAGDEDNFASVRGDATFDTRVDPLMPRNAVLLTAAIEHLAFTSGRAVDRTELDASGYLGFIRSTVVALHVTRLGADRPLPPYLQPLLGGWSSLRGFQAGAFVGDMVVGGSAELRVPLTSAVRVTRLGVSAFVDTGSAYDKGDVFRTADLHTGVGGSVWVLATVIQISVAVAHGIGVGTRVNFGGAFTF